MISNLKKWFMAIRPSSLFISFIPVFIGTSMAFGDGIEHFPTAFIALLGALVLHIGVNLTNDYFDLKKGADKDGDYDPMRRNLVGEIDLKSLKIACFIPYILLIPISFYLIKRGGMPIAVIGILSVLASIFYTAGKKPLGYQGLGDLIVFIFFGPIAVAATYYVQSFEINTAVCLAGFAPGLYATGVLAINNIRDIERDRGVDKKTLAVRFGKTFVYGEYIFCVIFASLMPVWIYLLTEDHIKTLLCATLSLAAIPIIIKVLKTNDTMEMNKSIGMTVNLSIIYSIIFSIGWVI